MGGTRFGRARLAAVRAGGPCRLPTGVLTARSLGCLAALLVAALVLVPASALAEPLCTDTWTGPAEGSWQTAADWSTGKVPSSSDVACIGEGKTVKVAEGTDQASVLLDKGALKITGGTLEVGSALEASSVGSLVMSGGTLTGAATVDVSGSFAWEGESTMSGSGSTVVLSGASGTLNGTGKMKVTSGRMFVNEGTSTLSAGHFDIAEGSVVKNMGTLKVNSESMPAIGFEGTLSTIKNSGTFERTEGAGNARVEPKIENSGTVYAQSGSLSFSSGGSSSGTSEWHAAEGKAITFERGSFALVGGALTGPIIIEGAEVVSMENVNAKSATVTLSSRELSILGGTTTVGSFAFTGGTVTGNGTLDISESLLWSGENMEGSGSTVLMPGASGTLSGEGAKRDEGERLFVNESTMTLTGGHLGVGERAEFKNIGTFKVDTPTELAIGRTGESSLFLNIGTFEKIGGATTATVEPPFESLGSIIELSGHFNIQKPVFLREAGNEYGGTENPSTPGRPHATCGDPVSCATGNYAETQTDFAIGGRGVGLDLARTYNSQAGAEGVKGAFGYGWTSSFSDHLVVEKASKKAVLHQADGATVTFAEGSGESFTAPIWTQDTLSGTGAAGYTLTFASQIKYKFAGSSGRLESVTDRDGNATTLAYNEAGRLETITDPTSRKITLAYNSEGLVESAKDPMGHTVKYAYESGNLKSVTQPAEEGLRWQFKYDGSHELTEMTDGRGGKTVNEYNGSHQVTKQEDPAGHKLKFEYEPFHTKITNEITSSVTSEYFTSNDEPSSLTRGFGTSSATTESFTYNEGGYVTSITDGNEHTTTYGYNSANDRTSMVDPNKNETKWTYDSTHDVETMTTPKGETTTIKREAHGNPETVERPAPEGKTQTTKYKYKTTGELESVEDPLKRVWKYEYDTHGNRTAEIDPLTDKRTWEYNEDSQETATVSPRGNVTGGKPTEFTTKIERDSQGRPLKITDPLGHTTKYTYDGDGNVETVTDGNSHTTKYIYNGDNQPTKVEAPSKAVTETEYDGAGQVISQTDGNKDTTKYKRNAIEEVTEVTDPLARVTKKEYDAAGNLKTLEDPAKRTTTYKYDPANRLEEVSYSDGKTPTIKYEYDADGDRTKMTDGTGTTKYTYDQLDRLTESENGHKEVSKYEYDLANEQTKITYPNTKSVTRAFDNAGRLEKVTDWSSNVTKFTYNPDSAQATTLFPSATKDEDKYAYNNADQMSEAKMLKSTETLASLVYTRDNDGQVKKTTSKGLPGAEITENTYDENNRLTKSGSEYKYDPANNPTTIGAGTYKYDKASELETGPSLTYTYNELGERTKTKPTTGPATTYGYDQAGNMTSVERPKEGETSEIKDTYAYNGEGLRASQTISGTTTNLAWDTTESLPLILSDETNSYIYGPGGIPVEQVSSGGTVTYLHHDQQGSTRLLTGTAGTVTGKCTYGAYGTPTCEGAATTPLGYDGQYTSTDTGLIYMRARVYDPATVQFLSVDPMVDMTRLPYAYAVDNPLNLDDPSGLIFGFPGTPSWSDLATRFVGFWDGFTRPLAGGTAALRNALGWNGGLDTCSAEYELASKIGGLDLSVEAGAALGGGSEVLLDNLLGGLPRLGPVVSPIAAGTLGGLTQHAVAGESITPTTAGQGAVGGLAGELATGLVPGTSAAGTAGAVNAALGLLW